ncbi:MAG: hypothetical protein JO316_11815 [Abitibacteriaceae bacterium]|nr:hypothetical protein [Abditibacteriaceae bacterium]
MNLRDAMRKAAGLVVELPPETVKSEGDEFAGSSDLDDVLARVEQSAQHSSAVPDAEPNMGGPTKTVEQIVRDAEGPNLDEIKVATPGEAGAAPAGEVTPAKIYEMAHLPATPFTAEQMLDMLASLPSELPLDTKRQTVKVTLGSLGKSLGATPETIVTDASRKLAALNAYIENLSKQADGFVTHTETEIAALQAQIEEKRKAILGARQKVQRMTQMCDQESHRIDDVLEFFSLDVPPSKYAAPGSHEAEHKPQ